MSQLGFSLTPERVRSNTCKSTAGTRATRLREHTGKRRLVCSVHPHPFWEPESSCLNFAFSTHTLTYLSRLCTPDTPKRLLCPPPGACFWPTILKEQNPRKVGACKEDPPNKGGARVHVVQVGSTNEHIHCLLLAFWPIIGAPTDEAVALTAQRGF